jgi:hypothetical protein
MKLLSIVKWLMLGWKYLGPVSAVVKPLVEEAMTKVAPGGDKAAWVKTQVKGLFPRVPEWVVNLLIELCVATLFKTAADLVAKKGDA